MDGQHLYPDLESCKLDTCPFLLHHQHTIDYCLVLTHCSDLIAKKARWLKIIQTSGLVCIMRIERYPYVK